MSEKLQEYLQSASQEELQETYDSLKHWLGEKESIDEDKLDKLALKAYPLEDDAHWNRYQCELQEV